jgi:uncharacterized protein with von Willebrand factor type A (vWA) domain
MGMFSRRRRDRESEWGPYVNILVIPPFGIRMGPSEFKSIAAAKAKRLPGERTVRYRQALALMVESARDEQRWDALRMYNETRAEALQENAFLKAHAGAQTQPVKAVADFPRRTWRLLETARLALAGLGHVRPRQLVDGRWSTDEVEVVMTQHDVAVLSGRLAENPPPVELSYPAARVKA